jgi:tetratricopeptide (TPR) repeat protein
VNHPPILLGTSSFTAAGWDGSFYPKGMRSSDYLAFYAEALSEYLEMMRLAPDNALGYGSAMIGYVALNRIDEAKAIYRQAQALRLENPPFHSVSYAMAFLTGDAGEMQRQVAWSTGKPGSEDLLLSFESDSEAFSGHLQKAKELSKRAVESARRNDQNETAAGDQMNSAFREAELGNFEQARRDVAAALTLASTRDSQIQAALIFARIGDLVRAQKMSDELAKRFPVDTLVNHY